MTEGRLPVVVAFDVNPGDFPRDPLVIQEPVSIDGSVLTLNAAFGGGCAPHEIDLVVWGGWLESFPVQVNAFLSHEDNDDPCDAFLTEMRSFDLSRLAEAYRDAYPGSAPGQDVLILLLQDFNVPEGVRRLEFRF